MSIASEIQRLQQAKADIYRALSRRGIHIPSDSTVDEYAPFIDPITSGETITYLDNPQGYLSFKFVTDGTVKWQNVKGDIQYSKNGGSTWTAFNGATVSATTGDEIWFKGSLTGGCGANSETGCSKFYASGYFFASGNIQSLCSFNNTLAQYHFAYLFSKCSFLNVDENNKLLLPATKLASYCYIHMFNGCTSLTTAPELPATTLANYCYNNMFHDCTSLTTAPELPATRLANNCYSYMFEGCTGLTTAPELLVTTLAQSCYNSMFYGCTSLTVAPELPATTLATYCYQYMFSGCTSLTTAPVLSATTLANYCYNNMFHGCTSLTTAPELPATRLATYCYQYMFQGCTSLTTAPELPATTLADDCYYSMFQGCTSLTTAPELPATRLAYNCYSYMFGGCTNLNYIKAMFTTTPSTSYTNNWVNGVASSGTFVKNSAATWNVTGINGIPSGWTVQTASPCNIITYTATAKLDETTSDKNSGLHTNAFNTTIRSHTFNNGVGTIEFNDDVTSIGNYAFSNCSDLTSVTIPNSVTSIGTYAFQYCSGLTSIIIPDNITSIGTSAFLGCSNLINATISDSVTSIGTSAFYECSSLTSVTVKATTPPTLGSSAFNNTKNCPIYVPSASVGTYKSTSGWSTYASRIQAIQ